MESSGGFPDSMKNVEEKIRELNMCKVAATATGMEDGDCGEANAGIDTLGVKNAEWVESEEEDANWMEDGEWVDDEQEDGEWIDDEEEDGEWVEDEVKNGEGKG